MTKHSIKSLSLVDKNRVLELEHGSCNHLKMLLKEADDLTYFGMETSKIKKEIAESINGINIRKRKALFQLYNGIKIPYVACFFDRILTVNTICYMEKPLDFFNEMYRVLKPGGKFVLTFTNDGFNKKGCFIDDSNSYTVYDIKKIKKLISQTNFILSEIHKKKEYVKNEIGEKINIPYFVIVMDKKEKEVDF